MRHHLVLADHCLRTPFQLKRVSWIFKDGHIRETSSKEDLILFIPWLHIFCSWVPLQFVNIRCQSKIVIMSVHSTIPILGAPDYRDWFSMALNESGQEKNRVFMRDIIPCLSDYAEGTTFSAFVQDHEWIKDFTNPGNRFAATLLEVERHPNETTITLAEFVKHLAGTLIARAWRENMNAFIERVE